MLRARPGGPVKLLTPIMKYDPQEDNRYFNGWAVRFRYSNGIWIPDQLLLDQVQYSDRHYIYFFNHNLYLIFFNIIGEKLLDRIFVPKIVCSPNKTCQKLINFHQNKLQIGSIWKTILDVNMQLDFLAAEYWKQWQVKK